MTDQITDQDRRIARVWAEGMTDLRLEDPDGYAAARVILATVDAPAPTLAEELRYRADLLDNGDPDGDTPHVIRTLATRAEQMEHDLAEARAEVERLAAVNENLRRTDNYREFKEFLGVQKGAERNAETPDPADVKPGEAWIVECRGERRNAVKDMDDDVPWNTVAADGLFFSEENENVTLLHRLVPAPRVITNPDELEEQVHGTIIRDGAGDMYQKILHGWYRSGSEQVHRSDDNVIMLPVTVLWEPEA